MKQSFLQRVLPCLGFLMLQASAVFAGIAIITPPSTPPVTDGTTLTLQVVATSTSVPANTLLYQWFKQNGSNFDPVSTRGTSNKYTVSNVTSAAAGVYRVEVYETVTAVSQISTNATVTVINRPRITVQPIAPVVLPRDGENVSFTVSLDASGTPDFKYTWQKKVGSTYRDLSVLDPVRFPLPVATPATTNTLPLNSITLADAGTYRVSVSSTLSSVVAISKEVILKMNSRPVIQTQHVSALNITFGATGTLKVVAAGNPKLQYRWYKNNVAIPNSDKATLSIKGTDSTADGVAEGPGSYKVKIINGYSDFAGDPPSFDTAGTNTESPSPAVVRVIRKPRIATQPAKLQEVNIVSGPQNASVSVAMDPAGDPGTFTYQWFKDNKPYAGPGALTNTITFTPVTWQDRGSYKVVVRNQVGFVTSTPGVLNVIAAPMIISQTLGPVFGATKGSVKFNVVGGGTAPLKYEWFFKPVGAPDYGANVVGKTATLSLSALQNTNTGEYKCVVTSTAKSPLGTPATSLPIFVQVDDAPKIITQTKVDGVDTTSTNVVTGRKLHLLVAASGTDRPVATPDAPANPLTYQWQKNNVDISGQTTNSLLIDPAQLTDSGRYRCMVKNKSGIVYSNALTIVVSGPPVASIQPTSAVSGVEGEKIETAVGFTATGTPTIKYRWQIRSGSAPNYSWTDVTGKTTQKLSFPVSKVTDDGIYRCVASNAFGEVASSDVQITVLPIPSPTLGPVPGVSTVEFYPRIARGGEKVRIFGSDLRYTKSVSFGTEVASYVIESDHSILVTVPVTAPTTATSIKVSTANPVPTLTVNTFTRTTSFANNISNPTILTSAALVSKDGDNRPLSVLDFNGNAYYEMKVPKRSIVSIYLSNGQIGTNMVDLDLWVYRQVTSGAGAFKGADGVTGFPASANSRSNYVGDDSANFTTDMDNQTILIDVYGGAAFTVLGYEDFGPFTLTIGVTPVSSSSSEIPQTQTYTVNVAKDATGSWTMESSNSASAKSVDLAGLAGGSFSFGGDASRSSEPVVLSHVPEQGAESRGILMDFNMGLTKSDKARDDQFGWQIFDADGKAVSSLWVNAADGSMRVSEAGGTSRLLGQKIAPGGGLHQFEVRLSASSARWEIWMDGVLLFEGPVLPSVSSSALTASIVWDLGQDSQGDGARLLIEKFTVVGE